ncbi:hypothetical protein Pla123a_32700 [Posidoniimonas polymericola]|uniref:Uncharacterized protein n=1 Tax=Posidoniimonas polymericola TaxID=2528002 RepID=A0A5C5YFE5_9BACT|nr:hypothetical protein [Posidoniimonas polymericola]TWT74447.1 hypothetical protein Pla123a_32700 [Posidoniimonas polymericola]
MTRCRCKSNNVAHWAAKLVGGLAPGVGLLLMPKCPLCLAAYLALLTGVTLSASAATTLYYGVAGALAALLCVTAVSCVWSIRRRPRCSDYNSPFEILPKPPQE